MENGRRRCSALIIFLKNLFAAKTSRFAETYWTWADRGSYYGIPFTNFIGWFLTALVACRMTVTRRPSNFWAGFVGTAIILFFTSIALAHTHLVVALLGFGLCALRLSLRLRPSV
ncbi:MAG TPA: carotenoid biosynthesis protein [Pyrinomonadaceae bacterium]